MFHQHRDLHRAAGGDVEDAGLVGVLHLDGDVGFEFAHQAVADGARGDVLALLAGERAVVDGKLHLHGGRVDFHERQRFKLRGADQRLADINVFNARGHADDAAGGAAFRVVGGEAGVAEGFHHLRLLLGPILAQQPDGVAFLDAAAEHLAHGHAADVVIPLDVGNEHGKRCLWIGLGLGDELDDFIEQRDAVLFLVVRVIHEIPVAGRAINEGRVELVLGGVEVEEEFQHLVVHLERIRERAVDLVDDHDRLESLGQRLAQDEAGLRLRAAEGVHDQQHAIHHFHHTLHLGAEVGVARGVHDVDRVAFPVDRGVLGLDGDAFLAFEVHRVHGPLGDGLVFTVGAAGLEQLVHERGFAVVNVGDDGEVADLEGHVALWDSEWRGRGYGGFLPGWQGAIRPMVRRTGLR